MSWSIQGLVEAKLVCTALRVEVESESGEISDILTGLLERTDFIASLRHTGDAQDEARAENVEELVAVLKQKGLL